MSLSTYYCHNCRMGVPLRDGDFVCARCGSEFIEELAVENRTSIFPFLPFQELFGTVISDGTHAVGSSSSSSSSTNSHAQQSQSQSQSQSQQQQQPQPQHPTSSVHFVHAPSGTEEDNIAVLFLNQLLANLSAQGAQIELQIGREPFGHGNFLHGQMGDYAWGDGGLDQIVTQLLNQFEGGTSPVDPKFLANLPMTVVNQSHVDSDAQCTTCMENFKKEETVALLDCHHLFHRECILPWLRRHNTCPICRQAVDASRWPSSNPLDELD